MALGNHNDPFTRLVEWLHDLRASGAITEPIFIQSGHTEVDSPHLEAVQFLPPQQFAARMREARAVIVHAGSGSIITALKHGQRPIVVPRRASRGEHVNDHQQSLAEALAARGWISVADSRESLQRLLERALAPPSICPPPADDALENTLMRRLVSEFLCVVQENHSE